MRQQRLTCWLLLLLLAQSVLPAYAFAAAQLPGEPKPPLAVCHNSEQPLPADLVVLAKEKPACPICPLLLIGWQNAALPDLPDIPACRERVAPPYEEFRARLHTDPFIAYLTRAPPETL